jgi:protein O-mannosyl-transferase
MKPSLFAASRSRVLLVGLLLIIGTFALYWPVRTHDFIGLDDPDYVTENPNVKNGLTPDAIAWAFRSNEASNWHPLTWLSHMLDCQLFGLNAGAHHLMNVGVHAANAVLLFLLLRWLTNSFWRAALVALLFAWHPLRVESVAWVSERKDVLSVFFGLLALHAYARFGKAPDSDKSRAGVPSSKSKVWYSATLVFFALSLTSKPMLVTLPLLLLLLDYWPLQRVARAKNKISPYQPGRALLRLLPEKIPFLVLSALSCGLTVWAQGAGHAIGSTQAFPIGMRVANALVAYGKYIEKLFWPTKLAVFYPYPVGAPIGGTILAATVLLALSYVAWRQRVSRPWIAVGWFWFVGTLVPVIGLVQVGGQAWADRYSYFPGIGLLIAIIWTATALIKTRVVRTAAFGASLAVLAVFAAMTGAQVRFWHDSKTLFEHARAVTDRNYLAWTVLGGFLGREGKVNEALEYYQTALSMQPDYSGALTGMGNVFEKLGDYEKALAFQNRALQAAPFDAEVVNSRAAALARLGRFAEAETGFRQSLQLRPDYGEAIFNLGTILQRVGRMNEAMEAFQRAVVLMPQSTNVLFAYGIALMRSQRPAEALSALDRVTQLVPNWSEARYQRGLVLMELGKINEAAAEFKSLLKVMTNRAPALDGLGFALAMQGQTSVAEGYFLEAIQTDPKFANAHLHFAMMLSRRGNVADAIKHYRSTLEAETNQPAALNNLAWILATTPNDSLRNGKDAVMLAERACELTNGREPFFLGTLAAAYAETGDFRQAIATAQAARDLANAHGLQEVVRRNDELLVLYRAGQPFRDTRPTQ